MKSRHFYDTERVGRGRRVVLYLLYCGRRVEGEQEDEEILGCKSKSPWGERCHGIQLKLDIKFHYSLNITYRLRAQGCAIPVWAVSSSVASW